MSKKIYEAPLLVVVKLSTRQLMAAVSSVSSGDTGITYGDEGNPDDDQRARRQYNVWSDEDEEL